MTHIPVMLEECVDFLLPERLRKRAEQPWGVCKEVTLVDATLGRCGHSAALLNRYSNVRIIGIDRDDDAISYCKETLGSFGDRIIPVKSEFSAARGVLTSLGFEKADGLLCDLGVSSPQLDEPERGFSYRESSPLDMRMDRGQILTAGDIVNNQTKGEIERILREYGEERYSGRIASAIVRERQNEPILTTDRLASVITAAMPKAALREKQPPPARSFLGLRLAVNSELSETSLLLKTLPDILAPGGRGVFVSFHSLEDRIVKNAFRDFEKGCKCPKDYPCVCGFTPSMKTLTHRPITPGEEEKERNNRARSAKLRAAEKL